MWRLVLLIPLLVSCARYAQHDKDSYCEKRQLTPRLRPEAKCRNGADSSLDCNQGLTLEFYWKCERWSSW